MTVNRTELDTALRDTIVKVTFTKVNGKERTIYGTLAEEHIRVLTGATDKLAHEKAVRAANPEVQPIWDTETGGWRSFRWDNVTEWTTDYVREADPREAAMR